MSRRTKKVERVVAVRKRRPHFFGGLIILLVSLWVLGFANFMLTNAAADSLRPTGADDLGIVVLTGTRDRIDWGMEALSDGRGERLLISGVNEVTTRDELQGLVDDPRGLFECCVDLDYTSRDTIANAREAAAWADAQGFSGLWVVTSYYHMPRALLELHYRDPGLALYPLRVEPVNYDINNWWYPNTFRILAWEYTKYELALMRIRLAHLVGL